MLIMTRRMTSRLCLATLALAALVVSAPAMPDKPGRVKDGMHEKEWQHRYDDHRGSEELHFSDSHRHIVYDYYRPRFRAGNCPPGLAKKNNGCLPPGQAKKWALGHPLPKDLRYYALPRDLWVRLPAPPPDYRYVRVDSDILLIAIGTSLVVDAIEGIGR